MQFFRDMLIEDVQFLSEGVGDEKKYYIEGIFLQSDIVNRNKRIYPNSVMEKEVHRYKTAKIDTSTAWGCLNHPESDKSPNIDLSQVSHRIVSLERDGKNWIGKARLITANPMGNIAKNLMEDGGRLGVSSRGLASLKKNGQGINEVQSDFYLVTAADIVADPSAPDAFVNPLMEGKEWMLINGVWTEQMHEEAIDTILSASSVQLEEKKIEVFTSFLKAISGT